jgi:hypothetical protein
MALPFPAPGRYVKGKRVFRSITRCKTSLWAPSRALISRAWHVELGVPDVAENSPGASGALGRRAAAEEFGSFLSAQMALWGRVVRENNIRSE